MFEDPHKNTERRENIDSKEIRSCGIEITRDTRADYILDAHMEEYSGTVQKAHSFVGEKLGMSDVQPLERIAILPSRIREEWDMGTVGGKYLPEADITFIIEPSDNRPKTAKLQMISKLVHEMAHSASITPENVVSRHAFYNEAIAGLAEYFLLKELESENQYTKPSAKTVTREIDGRQVSITIPGDFRAVDADEVLDGNTAESTQGMVAAMVVGIGLKRHGSLRASEILASVRKGDSSWYEQLEEIVESIEPGFAAFIEKQPRTTEGIIKIAERAQSIVGM